jgi:F-type H+-transporting ATPase subunit b
MEALGINPVLLIAQVISFLVLLFVMKKFLYGYIQKALEERRSNIKKIFTDKEELEKRLTDLEMEQEEKRKELQKLSKKLEAEARVTADEIKKEIVAKAQLEGERELVRAKERITQEIIQAKKSLANEAKVMAKSIVEKVILDQSKNSKWQQEELDKSLEMIKQTKSI